MIKVSKGILMLGLGILFILHSCQQKSEESDLGELTQFVTPKHFPEKWYDSDRNPLTPEGVQLGRKLFYEPLLSLDGRISCASCHHQAFGFSDPGKALSTGIKGKLGLRNSPALANMAWMPSFMADGGINHIEVMPLAPLTDSLEMGEELINILAKLQSHPRYPEEFEVAFGDDSITAQKMLFALAQFMSVMISDDSKYDKVLQGLASFTPAEENGYQLFRQHCSSCHKEPMLSDFSLRNNGLDSLSADLGRARITDRESDRGKFKVPGLRNVALSAPYMHDGRFENLEAVLEHYTEGIASTPNLDSALAEPIVLSEEEQANILLFLSTLTDHEYLTNPALGNPH